MDTWLTTYPKDNTQKLFYFEKRKKFQKKLFSQIFLKNKHFLEFSGKKYFFVFELEFRTGKKSYQKSLTLRFLGYL